jgi:prolyl oligopeptidase
MEALLRVDSVSLPVARNGRYFFTRRQADQNLAVITLRQGLYGADEVLIDPHPMSADLTTSVMLLDVAQDGRLLLYGLREGGADEVVVCLFDVDRRQTVPGGLPRGRYYGLALQPDKRGMYYSRHTAEGPRVYYHRLDTGGDEDAELFGQGYGPDKIISLDLSDDGRFLVALVLHGSAGSQTEVHVADLAGDGSFRPVVNDIAASFFPTIAGQELLLWTNWQAPNWRIIRLPLADPGRERWQEIVPEGDAVIQGVSVAGGRVFVNYLRDVSSHVAVFTIDGTSLRQITFPRLGSISGIAGRWDDEEAFFLYTSFPIPPTIYRYDTRQGSQAEWFRQQVPLAGDAAVNQVWYQSADGTRVPMFIVHREGLLLDGARPTLLTGYGGFSASMTPAFSAGAALWVERGGVFAVPNLRGGGEFGEDWHRAGMLEQKQHVFDDFLAAAEYLIAQGYTQPAKLAIRGGSNGGLLVGAALTQRPDLFRAVVCSYPLLDMLRYDRFLVAQYWVAEYGSASNAEQFPSLAAYSPYQHVEQGTQYPAVLMISGDLDTRVDPLHARKMTARLQASGTSRPVLLLYHTKSGHVGGLPLHQVIDDAVDEYSFLYQQLGELPE